MMIFNTSEILSRHLGRTITQIGLYFNEIDVLTLETAAMLSYDRIHESVQFPDLPKEIKREKLT